MSKKNSQGIFYIFKEIKKENTKEIFEKRFKCTFSNCHKVYSHQNKMLAHLRTHYNILPFKCTFCDKSFNEKGNLKTHIRIHTGERPFHCSQCDKAFKAFGQLKDHISSHSDIRPFQCPICKKFYRRKGILKNHILTHNKQKVIKRIRRKYICAHCNNKFPSGKKLKLHMQLHIEKEEISSEVSSSSINIDEECYHINSICEEMFNMLKNDIEKKEFCCDILTETESCDDLVL